MAQSHSRVLIHLVFSTQGRAPSLVAEVRRELHPYLASVLKSKGCTPIEVGGMPDHVRRGVLGDARKVRIGGRSKIYLEMNG